MNARADDLPFAERPAKSPVYEANDFHPEDAVDIDWEEIIATTQDDVEAGRYAFSTEDYPTHEEGMAALWKWMCTLGNGESNEASNSAPHPAGP